MLADQRDITMRFTNLIDALYEAKVKIYLQRLPPLPENSPRRANLISSSSAR